MGVICTVYVEVFEGDVWRLFNCKDECFASPDEIHVADRWDLDASFSLEHRAYTSSFSELWGCDPDIEAERILLPCRGAPTDLSATTLKILDVRAEPYVAASGVTVYPERISLEPASWIDLDECLGLDWDRIVDTGSLRAQYADFLAMASRLRVLLAHRKVRLLLWFAT